MVFVKILSESTRKEGRKISILRSASASISQLKIKLLWIFQKIVKNHEFYRFFSNYQCKRQLSATSAANVRAGRQTTQPLSSALPNIQEVQTDTNDIDIAKTKGLI